MLKVSKILNRKAGLQSEPDWMNGPDYGDMDENWEYPVEDLSVPLELGGQKVLITGTCWRDDDETFRYQLDAPSQELYNRFQVEWAANEYDEILKEDMDLATWQGRYDSDHEPDSDWF